LNATAAALFSTQKTNLAILSFTFIFSSLFANKRRENEPKEKKHRNRFQFPSGI